MHNLFQATLMDFQSCNWTPNLSPRKPLICLLYGQITNIPTFTVSVVNADFELSVQKVMPFWKAKILGYIMDII